MPRPRVFLSATAAAVLSICGATVGFAQDQAATAAQPAPLFGDSAPTISQQDFLARADATQPLLVLDVRTPEEFAAGHVPGAVNIPHDQLAARLDELNGARDHEIVAYCRSGRRSAMALTTLHDAGFKNLRHLEGDFLAWQAADRPVETAAPAKAEARGELQD